jgi:cytosine/adenosine deaminase-related metal-dependent hydrolase
MLRQRRLYGARSFYTTGACDSSSSSMSHACLPKASLSGLQAHFSARFLGREQDIGTLAPGKCADLVLVKGDPSARISDIENVEIVFKDGAAFDSHRLIDSVRGQAGIR